MAQPSALPRHVVRLSGGAQRAPIDVSLEPDAAGRAAVADALGIRGVRKLRFAGRLDPEGRRDWRLEATLGATVVQDCVVTLEPVVTRIDDPVTRRYLESWQEPTGEEVEMPDDDEAGPLPASLDLAEVMIEALALALPLYPRAEGVEEVDLTVTEPGAAPIESEEAKPFAGLQALRDRIGGDDDADGK
ncbi:YceD family protein [Wenxinia marina]|uniref:Putative metal-binding, possibly nucleic acid-binding protein n=1 Tax=Wenxinia marina DSM 24838 TaxID=1123501 RepID=A0A0D0Q5U8_9RHOB|nr:DUF177 domain-containing protein [Wenxinia marina]KIQ67867.1 putative metal-binding, possibly nucleic acid-binding protein [Wenxinia marina DSM 24838]GGL74443.1 hypothetical protein GCM10011392_31300 [Wenxinia marina]